jgi:hypothetical protein
MRTTSSVVKTKGCGEYTVGDGDDGNPDVTVEGRVYTRDLYHCAGLVSGTFIFIIVWATRLTRVFCLQDARPELGEDLAAALCAAVHGPRAVWGALWYASGSALCVRLRDAVTYSEGAVSGPDEARLAFIIHSTTKKDNEEEKGPKQDTAVIY